MNEENKEQTQSKLQTQQDAKELQDKILEKKEQLIDESPKLNLAIKDAPFVLESLFEHDGTPKGDFRVSDRYKKKVALAFQHVNRKPETGEIYYGRLVDGFSPNTYKAEYLIAATPTFLTDEELAELQSKRRLSKMINGKEITFGAPDLQRDNYSSRVERYRETIVEPRSKVKELDSLVAEIERVKSQLPRGSYEVIIEQPEDRKETGYPHR